VSHGPVTRRRTRASGGGVTDPGIPPVMALERSYAVVLEPEAEGGYSAHIPAFRGAHTQGETVEECLANAREVIALHAEVMTERGEPLRPLTWRPRSR